MASSTDYTQAYQKAERAYMQGSYEDAAGIVDQLAADYPTDPSVLLLRGHIYCYGLHRYSEARAQYQAVLDVTSDPEFVDFAHNGLAYAEEQSTAGTFDGDFDALEDGNATLADASPITNYDHAPSEADFFDDNDDLTEFNLDAADVDLDLSSGSSAEAFSDSPFNVSDQAAEIGAEAVDTADPFTMNLDDEAVDTAAVGDNPFGGGDNP
ncbi:MAG: chemotaxis protein, partial [Cyanobacteria bacterium P01_D01_bin.6]